MKKKPIKIIEQYKADEFGLPLIIRNVPVVEIDGYEVVDIDHEKIAKVLFMALILKPFPFTGSEVKFMRLFLGLTLDKLAKHLHITHATILSWEKHGNEFTKMTDSIETMFRIFCAREGAKDDELIGVLVNNFFDKPKENPADLKKKSTIIKLSEIDLNEEPEVLFSDDESDSFFVQEA